MKSICLRSCLSVAFLTGLSVLAVPLLALAVMVMWFPCDHKGAGKREKKKQGRSIECKTKG